MKRGFGTVVGLILIWVIILLIFRWDQAYHWVYIHTGMGGTGVYYGFWSGFGSDLGEYVIVSSVFSGIWMHYQHINCHNREGWLPWGCWRLGKYSAAGGQYKLCHKHHPDLMGEHPSMAIMNLHHQQHKAKTRSGQ